MKQDFNPEPFFMGQSAPGSIILDSRKCLELYRQIQRNSLFKGDKIGIFEEEIPEEYKLWQSYGGFIKKNESLVLDDYFSVAKTFRKCLDANLFPLSLHESGALFVRRFRNLPQNELNGLYKEFNLDQDSKREHEEWMKQKAIDSFIQSSGNALELLPFGEYDRGKTMGLGVSDYGSTLQKRNERNPFL